MASSSKKSSAVMTHREIVIVIASLMGGMFLSSLDQTIVGTSMRTIADDLHGLSLQAWVTTGYLVMSTISTPIYGKLSDIFGRRPLFIISIAIFLAGSLLSGLSTSMYELAAFRALQGLGAGGLMALPLAIMGDILAPRERAKYQGYFLAVFGISSVVGPLVGGVFAGTETILGVDGWRWVFLVNLPVAVLALVLVLRNLHLPKRTVRVRIDWWGAALVIVTVVPLLVVAEQGNQWGWGSPLAIACYVVGVAGAVAFCFVERAMGSDALIPLALFRSQTFSVATILAVLVGFGLFGAMIIIPLFLQIVEGATPTESGLLMLPMILGVMLSSIASGQIISRTGHYKIFPTLGTALMCAGFTIFSIESYNRPLWVLLLGLLLTGLGIGQLMPTLTMACQSSVGPRDIGVATSSVTFFRQIGGTLGTAVLFSVLFSSLPGKLRDSFRDPEIEQNLTAAVNDPGVQSRGENQHILALLRDSSAASESLNGDTSFLKTVDQRLAAPFLEAFSNAATSVFAVALGVVFIAFLVSFFLKQIPLRSKSALQESADLDASLAAQRAAEEMGALVAPDTAPIHIQRTKDSAPDNDRPTSS